MRYDTNTEEDLKDPSIKSVLLQNLYFTKQYCVGFTYICDYFGTNKLWDLFLLCISKPKITKILDENSFKTDEIQNLASRPQGPRKELSEMFQKIYGIKPPFFLVNHYSRTRFLEPEFLEPDFSNQISKNCKNQGRRIKGPLHESGPSSFASDGDFQPDFVQ